MSTPKEPSDDPSGQKPTPPGKPANPELEGYIAGLEREPDPSSGYPDGASDAEWRRGYQKGWKHSRRSRTQFPITWLYTFFAITAALIGSLAFVLGMQTTSFRPRMLGPGDLPVNDRILRPDMSGVEARLGQLSGAIEHACQSPTVVRVPSDAVQATIAATERPLLTEAIAGVLKGATEAGTGVVKNTDALRKEIVEKVIDVSGKAADSGAEALIERYLKKDQGKSEPAEVQITVTQNNGVSRTVHDSGSKPLKSRSCSSRKS